MKRFLSVLTIFITSSSVLNYAMEQNLEKGNNSVIQDAIDQRKQANQTPKKENFGDDQNVVVTPPKDVNIDILALQDAQQKKKEKKDKKEKKKKRATPDTVLADLEEGISPEEIDAQIIAQLKIYRKNMSSEDESAVRLHLEKIHNTPEYNDLQQKLLGDTTQTTRGFFGGTSATKEETALRELIAQQLTIQKQQLAAQQLLSDIEKKKLDQEIQRTKLHEDQIKEMKQTNNNMVTSAQTTRKIGSTSLFLTVVGIAVAIGAYFN